MIQISFARKLIACCFVAGITIICFLAGSSYTCSSTDGTLLADFKCVNYSSVGYCKDLNNNLYLDNNDYINNLFENVTIEKISGID